MAEDNLDGGIEIPISVYSDEQATKKEAEKISNIVKSVLGKKDIINLKGITNETGKTLITYSKQVKATLQQATIEFQKANRKLQQEADKRAKERIAERNRQQRQTELNELHSGGAYTTLKDSEKYGIQIADANSKLRMLESSFLKFSSKREKDYKRTKEEIVSLIQELDELNQLQQASKLEESLGKIRNRAKAEYQFYEAMGGGVGQEDRLRLEIKAKEAELQQFHSTYQYYADADELESENAQKLLGRVSNLNSEITKLKEQLNEMTRITAFQKLTNTIKRVGFYRIARNLFRVIENGLSDAMKSMAQFDSGVNDTLSTLTSQFSILSASVATLIEPLLEVITPIIQKLTTVIANFASGISYLIACLKGSSTYLKVNTEYLKDFSESMNKFSFDNFEALSGDSEDLFEYGSTNEGLSSSVIASLTSISVLIGAIGSSVLITWLMDGGIDTLTTSFGKLGTKIGTIAGYATAFYSFYEAIKGIVDTFQNWDDMSNLERVEAILKDIFYILAGIVALVGVFTHQYHLVVSAIAALGIASLTPSIFGYAEGGLVDSGSLFVAGESGAELVTTMPSGQTGVTNIAQFKQAMVEALYECSDLFQGGEGSVVLNLDGAEVARSKRFTSEMNRKNAGLNLR